MIKDHFHKWLDEDGEELDTEIQQGFQRPTLPRTHYTVRVPFAIAKRLVAQQREILEVLLCRR